MRTAVQIWRSVVLYSLLNTPDLVLGNTDDAGPSNANAPSAVARIVGGSALSPSAANYPFVANIVSTDPIFPGKKCTGTLVADRVVVTTANCLITGGSTWYSPELMSVAVGGSASENVYKVRQAFITDGYKRSTFRHNIGLVVLASPVPESVASPVRIYPGPFDIAADAVVAGYGLTATGSLAYPDAVQSVPVAILPVAECSFFADYDNATQICAYGGRGKDVCGGDEGAPLLVASATGGVAMLGVASYTTGPPGSTGLVCGNGDRLVYFEMGGSWAKWISRVAGVPYTDIAADPETFAIAHDAGAGSSADASAGASAAEDAGSGETAESASITAYSADAGAVQGPSILLDDSSSSLSEADSGVTRSSAAGTTALALLVFAVSATCF
ncbi:hypothetical protein H4S06_002280 [Coemansia sp. BCRC 34490]|nr:hypothetical protein H4S06_002280 [Coemansia sp. BCRC 34490]